jgi:hypothetical protein
MCYSLDSKGEVTVKFGSGNSFVTFTDLTVNKSKTKVGTEFLISIREKIATRKEMAAAERKFHRTDDGYFWITLKDVTFISGRDKLVYKDAQGKHAIPLCK